MRHVLNQLRQTLGIVPKTPKQGPAVFGFYSIYLTTFLYTFSFGLPLYIASTFIEEYVGKNIVGLVYSSGAFLALLLLVSMPPLLRRIGNRRSALYLISAMILVLFGLSFFESIFVVILLFILYQALLPVIVFNLDLFLESFSHDASTGSIRGYYLTLINVAMTLSPFLAGILIAGTNFSLIFFYSALFLLPALFLIFFSLKTFKDPLYVDISYKDALIKLRDKPNIRKSLFIQYLLRVFYIWLTIYLPIYLYTSVGITLTEILTIIAPASVIPFLILQIPLGKLADRLHNERKLLILGFTIASFGTMALTFTHSPNVFIWAGVLVVGRIGVAIIEVMSGTYFYKHVDASNVNLLSMFRVLRPVANITAPVLATIILVFFGVTYQYLFLVLGLILLVGIPLSYTLERTGGLEGW